MKVARLDRRVSALLGVVVFVMSCGDDGTARVGQSVITATTDTVSAVVSPMVLYVKELATMSHVDQRRAVDTLCTNWQAKRGDSQSINDYVNDLLGPLDRINAGQPAPTQDAISDAVTSACATAKTDPASFANAIATKLHIPRDDLTARVVEACTRYRTRLVRDKASGYTLNKDLDPFVRGIAAQAGVDDPALRSAVDAICPK